MSDDRLANAVARLEAIASEICTTPPEDNERTDDALALGAFVVAKTIHDIGKTIESLMPQVAAMYGAPTAAPSITIDPDATSDNPDLKGNPLAGGALSDEEIDEYLNQGT